MMYGAGHHQKCTPKIERPLIRLTEMILSIVRTKLFDGILIGSKLRQI